MTRATITGAVLAAIAVGGMAPALAGGTAQDFIQGFVDKVDAVANTLAAPKPVGKTSAGVQTKTDAAVETTATPPAAVAVPLPRLRPDAEQAAAAPVLANEVTEPDDTTVDNDMPVPRLRPDANTADSGGAPGTRLAALPPKPLTTEPLPKLTLPPPAARSACGLAIANLGVISTPLATIDEGDCGIAAPVAVASLEGGAVDFSGKAVIGCDLAEQLADWMRAKVEPAAEKAYGQKLTGLRIAASYACRTRDNIAGAKLSEHAHGAAIDISAFRIGDRWIEVGPAWRAGGADQAFLATVRTSACGPFTTVLGPGSDSFHTDHFHLDIIQRRTAGPSKGLYCH